MVDVVVSEDLAEKVKQVHRSFPTGVTIVTTTVEGIPYGLVVNAFSSVSMEPPMILVCINERSSSYPRFFLGNHFGVSILANDQIEIARRFARSGGDKFAEIAWETGANGAPLILGASAHLELDVAGMVPAGTHTIFVGKITTAGGNAKPPLVYFDSKFHDGSILKDPL